MSLTPNLQATQDELRAADRALQLELLVDFANAFPEVPERYRDQMDSMERVEECQSPVYLITEIKDGRVQVIADVPKEAPTTRGFASILMDGLNGHTVDEVLAVPADYPSSLGLNETVSLLRIRGMTGMLARIQRQVREATG